MTAPAIFPVPHRANDAVDFNRNNLADAPPRAAGVVQVVDEVLTLHAPSIRMEKRNVVHENPPKTSGPVPERFFVDV